MKAHSSSNISIEEYRQIEIENRLKYEYHNGKIYAQAGGSINHGLLCGNVFSALKTILKDSGCKPLNSEIKLYVSAKNSFVYPDTMVVCGDFELAEQDKNAITNPTVIVEVLSKSTAEYDRGDKFFLYRQIPTLKDYVLVEQDKAVVEIYARQEHSDLWRITRCEGLTEIIPIISLGIEVSLQAIYEDVAF